MSNTNGAKWIRPEKRLAIYLRDNMSCMWCGVGVEQDESVQLTLDHIKPRIKGGTNKETNLITCSSRCNSSRQDRNSIAFARAVANYVDSDAMDILVKIKNHKNRKLGKYLKQAKEMIEDRKNKSL
uniref:Putative homing endonuclease n=1 Tax=viral metagenome TaxID=1070528 RepID=A0A6M3LMK9_9ZZZZ